MKIYFATSIRGTSSNESFKINTQLIKHLKNYGTVLTEHFSDESILNEGETDINEREIYERDINWIRESDVVVAEVSNPSLGVGYEIRYAIEHKKKILCLFKEQNKKLSAMIRGCDKIVLKDYENVDKCLKLIDEFFVK
jgi:nucleoside 2-deoxyribosyltransferase